VHRRQSELDNVEVKAARGGTPRRLYEPLSACANRSGGGVLLFGLDESSDVSIVGVGDAQRLQEDITHLINRVDAMAAGQELRGLVEAGLVEPHGASRWTSYTLKTLSQPTPQVVRQTDEERILARVREYGAITNTECRDLLGVDEARAYSLLKKLSNSGRLKPSGKGRWRVYVLP
jgi:ATP-dependent DNA helicase RecG